MPAAGPSNPIQSDIAFQADLGPASDHQVEAAVMPDDHDPVENNPDPAVKAKKRQKKLAKAKVVPVRRSTRQP